jgi:hypothetical protein
MFSAEAISLAKQLNSTTMAGNLGGAYQLIRNLSKPLLLDVMLSAGFAAVLITDTKFTEHVQRQVAEACAQKVDGHTLTHQRRKRERDARY